MMAANDTGCVVCCTAGRLLSSTLCVCLDEGEVVWGEEGELERGGGLLVFFFLCSALWVSSAISVFRDTTGEVERWAVCHGLPGE
jgi:hypothetical protein